MLKKHLVSLINSKFSLKYPHLISIYLIISSGTTRENMRATIHKGLKGKKKIET